MRRTLEAAQQMGQATIGTEHLLLALLQEETGLAADSLRRAGIDFAAARAQLEALIPRRAEAISPRTDPYGSAGQRRPSEGTTGRRPIWS